jgi:hypothetical protein
MDPKTIEQEAASLVEARECDLEIMDAARAVALYRRTLLAEGVPLNEAATHAGAFAQAQLLAMFGPCDCDGAHA